MTKFEKIKKFAKDHKKQIIVGAIFAGGMVAGVLITKQYFKGFINPDNYEGLFIGTDDKSHSVLLGAKNIKTNRIETFLKNSNPEAVKETADILLEKAIEINGGD